MLQDQNQEINIIDTDTFIGEKNINFNVRTKFSETATYFVGYLNSSTVSDSTNIFFTDSLNQSTQSSEIAILDASIIGCSFFEEDIPDNRAQIIIKGLIRKFKREGAEDIDAIDIESRTNLDFAQINRVMHKLERQGIVSQE